MGPLSERIERSFHLCISNIFPWKDHEFLWKCRFTGVTELNEL